MTLFDLQNKIESLISSMMISFPELDQNLKISIRITKKTNYLMAMTYNPFNNSSIIFVDWFLRKANDQALTGAIAHELVHLVEDTKRNAFTFFINRLTQFFFVSKEERATDIEVINRGFGHELLQFQKFHDKHFESYNQKDGLTKKEIKKLLH